jgi:hypothetical protein
VLESANNLQTKILVIDVNSDLTTTSSQKTLNMEPFWGKYDHEPNTIVIEDSFLFLTVIYTPRYDKQSKSYEFLNISQAVVSLRWQTGTTWENCILTTEALSSHKTCNTKLIVNILHFPFITHTLKCDK